MCFLRLIDLTFLDAQWNREDAKRARVSRKALQY